MVSEDLTVRLGLDLDQADADLGNWVNKLDGVTQKAREVRDEVYRTISTAMRGIQQMIQAIRLVPQILGMTLDPLQSALLSTVSATVALITSMAVITASTGILAWVGVILGAVAVGIQISSTTKIYAEMLSARENVDNMKANIEAMRAQLTAVRF